MRKSRTSHSGDRQRSDGRSRSDSNCFAHSNNAFFQKFRENYRKQVSGDKSNQLYQSAFPLKHIPERLNFSYRLLGRNIFNKSSLSGNANFSDDNSPGAPNGKSSGFRNGNNVGRAGHFGGHYGPGGNRGSFGNGFSRNRRMEKRFKNYMRFQAQQGNLRMAESHGPRGQTQNNDPLLAGGSNAPATDGSNTNAFIYESPSYSGQSSLSRNRDKSNTASPENNNGNKHNRYGQSTTGLKRKKPAGDVGFGNALSAQNSWPGSGRQGQSVGQRRFDKRRRMNSRSFGESRFPTADDMSSPNPRQYGPYINNRVPRDKNVFGAAENPSRNGRRDSSMDHKVCGGARGSGRFPGNGSDRNGRPFDAGQQDAPLHSHAKRRALSCEREYNDCLDRASMSSNGRSSSSFYSSRSNSLSGQSSKSNRTEPTTGVRRSDNGSRSASHLSYSSDRSSVGSYSSQSSSSYSPGSDASMNLQALRREEKLRKSKRTNQQLDLNPKTSVARSKGKIVRSRGKDGKDSSIAGDDCPIKGQTKRENNQMVALRTSQSCRIGAERGNSTADSSTRASTKKSRSERTYRELYVHDCYPEGRQGKGSKQTNFDSRSSDTASCESMSDGTFNVREPQQASAKAKQGGLMNKRRRGRHHPHKPSSSQTKSSSRSSKTSQGRRSRNQQSGFTFPSEIVSMGNGSVHSGSANGLVRQGSNRTVENSPSSETTNRELWASNLRSQPTLHLSDAYDSDDLDEVHMDLSKPLHPIGFYVKNRQEMLEHMLQCVHGKRLTTMLPDILKNRDFEEIKARCLDQLECMSRKRLLCILEGREMVSSSGTEESPDESIPSNNVTSQHYAFNSNGLKINKLRPLRGSGPAGVEDFTERLSSTTRRQSSGSKQTGSVKKAPPGEGNNRTERPCSQRWRMVKESSQQSAELVTSPQIPDQPRFEGTCVYPDDDFDSYYNAFKAAPRGSQEHANSQSPESESNSISPSHPTASKFLYACSECGDPYSSSGLPSPSSYDSECSACETRNNPQHSQLCKKRFKRPRHTESTQASLRDPQQLTPGPCSGSDSDEEYWAKARCHLGPFDLSANPLKPDSIAITQLLETDEEEECLLARAELDFLDDSSKNRCGCKRLPGQSDSISLLGPQEVSDLALDNLTLTVSDLSINERSPATSSMSDSEAQMTDACDSTTSTDSSSPMSDEQSSDHDDPSFVTEKEMNEANQICDEFWDDFEKAAAVRSPSDSAIASDMSVLTSGSRCLTSRYLFAEPSCFAGEIPIELGQDQGLLCDYGACDHPSNPSQLVSYKEFLRNKIQSWLAKMESSKSNDADHHGVEESQASTPIAEANVEAEVCCSPRAVTTNADNEADCASSLTANEEDASETTPISDSNDKAVQSICVTIRDKLEIK